MNRTLAASLIVLIIAALTGALISVIMLSQAKLASLAKEYMSALSTPVLYGTVVSKDQDKGFIRIKSPDRYDALGEPVVYDIYVSGTEVYNQYLIAEQGVYTSLSEPKRSTIGDIPTGSTVAAFVRYRNGVGPITADRIYFGNPL